MVIKFDETDRRAVIRAIQDRLGVRLSPVGRRRKWLRDGQGRSYWILGGYGEWHGIPEDMMDAEASHPTGGNLVVATRKRQALQIFIGPLEPIVQGRRKLNRARQTTGDYRFTIRTGGNRMHINKVSGTTLRELADVSYTTNDKARDQNVQSARQLLDRLSPEEQRLIIRELSGRT